MAAGSAVEDESMEWEWTHWEHGLVALHGTVA
jgi:hypothetical protein